MLGPVFQRTTICKSTKHYVQRLVVRLYYVSPASSITRGRVRIKVVALST